MPEESKIKKSMTMTLPVLRFLLCTGCLCYILVLRSNRPWLCMFNYFSGPERLYLGLDEVVERCLKKAYFIFFVGMFFLYLGRERIGRKAKRVLVFDILMDGLLSVGTLLYPWIYAYTLKLPMTAIKGRNFWFVVFAALSLLTFLMGLVVFALQKQGSKEDAETPSMMEDDAKKLLVLGFAALLALGAFWVLNLSDIFGAYRDYKDNYGSYYADRPAKDASAEDEKCNYLYQGVAVGDDIYYVAGSNAINRVSKSGEAEPLLVLENENLRDLTYWDGYLYFTSGTLQANEVSRVSLSGEWELLFSLDDAIMFIGCRDGRFYYSTRDAQCRNVYCVDMADIKDVSKHELFLGGVSSLVAYGFMGVREELFRYVIYGDSKSAWDIMRSQEAFLLSYMSEKSGWIYSYHCAKISNEPDAPAVSPQVLVRYQAEREDAVEALAENVSCYNVRDDHLFYTVAEGETTMLYMANLDGSDAKQLAKTAEGGRCERMIVGDSMVVCLMVKGEEKSDLWEKDVSPLVVEY